MLCWSVVMGVVFCFWCCFSKVLVSLLCVCVGSCRRMVRRSLVCGFV